MLIPRNPLRKIESRLYSTPSIHQQPGAAVEAAQSTPAELTSPPCFAFFYCGDLYLDNPFQRLQQLIFEYLLDSYATPSRACLGQTRGTFCK